MTSLNNHQIHNKMLTDLINRLEKYFIKEGLRQAIPQKRQQELEYPEHWKWCCAIILTGLFIGFVKTTFWLIILASGLIPLIIFLLWLLLVRLIDALFELSPRRKILLGRFFRIITSFLSAVFIGILLKGTIWTLLFIFLASLSYLLLRYNYQLKFFAAIENVWRISLRSLLRTIRIMGLLLPLIVIFFLLSVFSSELWQSIGSIPTWHFIGAIVFILSLGVVIAISRTQDLINSVKYPGLNIVKNFADNTIALSLLKNFPYPVDLKKYLRKQSTWRHFELMYAKAVEQVRLPLRLRVISRLIISTVFLGLLISIYLWCLFSLLFTNNVIATFQTGLQGSLISPENSLLRVTIFLVGFFLTYFIVQVFTEEKVRKEMLKDLDVHMKNWINSLILYEICLTSEYQLLKEPVLHYEINTAEIEIVIPPGKNSSEIKHISQSIIDNFLEDRAEIVIFTAYECQKDNIYDWIMPCCKYQIVYTPWGEDFISYNRDENNELYQHSVGLECENSNQIIPDEWFGRSHLDMVISRNLWDKYKYFHLYHPYCYSENKILWLYLLLTDPFNNETEYRELTETLCQDITNYCEDLISIKEKRPLVICISLYTSPDLKCRQFHMIWRKQPEGKILVTDY